jgi:hypothetical protein
MAAGLGFKTFAVGEVLSAANVNGYLMQGVLVFANAAARDAAITSPQEGQFAYLKDTNVTTYYTGSAWANLDTTGMTNPMTTTGDTIYSSSGSTPARLGIGSTGQVLTVAGGVPSWATPAGGGAGLVWIGNTSFSATQTINVNDVFSTNYDFYRVFVTATASGSNPMLLRLRVGGSDTSSNYNQQALLADDTTTIARRNYTGTDDIQVGDIGADAGSLMTFDIANPFIAAPTYFTVQGMAYFGGTSIIQSLFGAIQTASTSFTGFSLLSTSNATGKLSVYGYAKA